MLKFVASYPISRRLLIAFALAAILPSVMIAIMGVYYVNQNNNRRDASSVISSAQDNTNLLSSTLHHMYTRAKTTESQVLSSLLAPGSTSHITVSSNVSSIGSQEGQSASKFDQDLASYQSLYDPSSTNMQPAMTVLNQLAANDTTPTSASDLIHTILSTSWPQYNAAQKAEMTLLQDIAGNHYTTQGGISGAVNKISSDARKLDSTYDAISGNWDQLESYVGHMSNDVNGVSTNDTQPMVFGTVAAFIFTLLIVGFAGILVNRSISGPLNELVLLTRRISKGDRHARATIQSADEISIVATAMNTMLDNIVSLVQETQDQRDLLQSQVEKLVSEVSGVGDGDLRVSAEVTADALGVLADSFNYMVEELSSLVVRVKKMAREVEGSTTMTTDRMAELVESSDRQIQGIALAAMEVERMANSSQQVVRRALALADSARDARVSAQGGRQAVRQTIEGMLRIHNNVQGTSGKVQTLGERSREINNIVEAISNIAHQTNRLALDAAIQAAMAGENGKGFGAVAADIRRLAERAKEQATTVGRIVRSVRDDIDAVAIAMNDTERETSAGSTLAVEAGASLESIVSVIERQAEAIELINRMAVQQQQSSSDVVAIMQSVSETTHLSTASTRDAAQNMNRVSLLAEQLLTSVEAFKLRDSLSQPEDEESNFSAAMEGPHTPANSFRAVSSTTQPSFGHGGFYQTPSASISNNSMPQFLPFPPSPQAWEEGTGSSNTQPPRIPGAGRSTTQPRSPQQNSWPAPEAQQFPPPDWQ